METKIRKIQKHVKLDEDLLQRANEALKEGKFRGITSVNGLINFSLETVINQNCVMKGAPLEVTA
jgi:hypothetical protein